MADTIRDVPLPSPEQANPASGSDAVSPRPLDYAATGTPRPEWQCVAILLLTLLLPVVSVCGLFVGFLIYGIAAGELGEEPNYLMLGVGEAVMVLGVAGLFVSWRLLRIRKTQHQSTRC